MAAFSRGIRSFTLRPFAPQTEYVCSRCVQLSTTASAQSGHNRWSKIKHDKGSADMKKNVQRSMFSKEITLASKLYGGDPKTNPKLANVLTNAKKAGFPKASMEAAIARGQGKSATGATLESVTLEVIMPPTVAMIIEAETDNRNRTLTDIRHIVKSHGGSVTPTAYLFQKKGRVAFEKDDRGIGIDEVLDDAIEAGAEDVETNEDGNIVLWTEPHMTTAAAAALQKSHGLKIESSDIIWDANEETKVTIDHEERLRALVDFVDVLKDNPSVQGVYANAIPGSLSDDIWEEFQGRLDA